MTIVDTRWHVLDVAYTLIYLCLINPTPFPFSIMACSQDQSPTSIYAEAGIIRVWYDEVQLSQQQAV